ncbi:hypothetical protein ABZV24_21355 [Streptomyces sp. NPDC005251]|uniref:hypothetical protein n=1 Tax=Streptomyces sp. NPDC005251 TaxID=3157166 RepID=UPI00339ED4EF
MGVERGVGRERYVPPPLPLVLVPEPYASLPGERDELPYGSLLDEPLPYEPPPDVDDDELS